MLQLDGYRYRLDAAIDPETNDIRQYRLCSTITTAPTGRFLHERTADHEFDDAVFLAMVQFVSRLYTTDTGFGFDTQIVEIGVLSNPPSVI